MIDRTKVTEITDNMFIVTRSSSFNSETTAPCENAFFNN
jgi:hypothetical protein